MRFLWFGRKKRPTLLVAPEPEQKLVEIFSVTDFVCETNPLQGVKGVEESYFGDTQSYMGKVKPGYNCKL